MPVRGKKKKPEQGQPPGGAVGRGEVEDELEQQSLYPSLASLHSQEDEEEFSCGECCRNTCRHLYNFTIASCQYVTCMNKGSYKDPDEVSVGHDLEVNEMQEKLRFHFMNPFQKWKYSKRRRFPWKLILQMVNIVLVTTQLSLFASSKFALTDFLQQNEKTFVKLFIQSPEDMDDDYNIPSPITTIYTYDKLFDQLNHMVERYSSLEEDAVGPYGYGWTNTSSGNSTKIIQPLHVIVKKYESGHIDPARRTVTINGNVTELDCTVYPDDLDGDCPMLNKTAIRKVIDRLSYRIERGPGNKARNPGLPDPTKKLHVRDDNYEYTYSIIELSISFNLSSIYLDSPRKPDCFQFTLHFTIKNDLQKGNMPMYLDVDTDMSECTKNDFDDFHNINNGLYSSMGHTVVDVLVIIFAVISTIQCLRSLFKSLHFSRVVQHFFRRKYKYRLKFHQTVPLYNLWFIGVTISNVMVFAGSIMKIVISYTVTSIELVDVASIILGLAVFAQWCCILRFLSYFDKYNMLLITLRLAMPSVLRFFVCTGIIYVAFLLCGWLVMGPYHPKFRNPYIASECLYSLINGDDMYNTYIQMSDISMPAWIFSKIYLYVFISLFIYVVLSVFISLIADTYETLHEEWTIRSKGLLQDFAYGQLDRCQAAKRTRGFSQSSNPENEDDEYELIRDITSSPTYGSSADFDTTQGQPLLVNGGPMMDARQHSSSNLTVPSTNERSPLLARPSVKLAPPTTFVIGSGLKYSGSQS